MKKKPGGPSEGNSAEALASQVRGRPRPVVKGECYMTRRSGVILHVKIVRMEPGIPGLSYEIFHVAICDIFVLEQSESREVIKTHPTQYTMYDTQCNTVYKCCVVSCRAEDAGGRR